MGIDNLLASIAGFFVAARIPLGSTSDESASVGRWLIAGLVYLTYYFVQEGIWSTTVGKSLFGLRVVRLDGKRAGLPEAVSRTLSRIFEVNPILLGALPGGLAIAGSKRRQRLGDMAAGTVVVTRRALALASQQAQLEPVPVLPAAHPVRPNRAAETSRTNLEFLLLCCLLAHLLVLAGRLLPWTILSSSGRFALDGSTSPAIGIPLLGAWAYLAWRMLAPTPANHLFGAILFLLGSVRIEWPGGSWNLHPVLAVRLPLADRGLLAAQLDVVALVVFSLFLSAWLRRAEARRNAPIGL